MASSPDPGTLFAVGTPIPGTPLDAVQMAANFKALSQTNIIRTADPTKNPPNAQDGMLQIDATDPTNIKLYMWLVIGGALVRVLFFQHLELGFAAPAVNVVQFGAPGANPWTVTHNLGQFPLIQAFDSLGRMFAPVPAAGFPSAAPTNADKSLSPAASSGDGSSTTLAISATPVGYVAVAVRGVLTKVGNGTKTACDCFFSGDGGTTARAYGAIVSGDVLYWNGTTAGYDIGTTDRVDLLYNIPVAGSGVGPGQCAIQQASANQFVVNFQLATTPTGFVVYVG